MMGEAGGLVVPLSSFWATKSRMGQHRADPTAPSGDAATAESTWNELVRWFEQEHEWAELVALLRPTVD